MATMTYFGIHVVNHQGGEAAYVMAVDLNKRDAWLKDHRPEHIVGEFTTSDEALTAARARLKGKAVPDA